MAAVFSEPYKFPEIYKIACLNSIKGCSCVKNLENKTDILRVFHAQSVHLISSGKDEFSKIETDKGICYYPSSSLIKMNYSKVLESKYKNLNHDLISLDNFVVKNAEQRKLEIKKQKHVFLGKFWPTYYHLAMEDFHPGALTDIISPSGTILGRASEEFLKQVTWEGTGITEKGLKIRYGFKKNRYLLSDQTQWGLGAGHGYHVYPYRTVAVNYPGLCEMLRPWIPGCTKAKAIGIMLYIKEVAEKNIFVNGKKHDGYFCATDTGAPYYIRKDRMDIFVGTHGGGNPYLPLPRQGNRMIEGGIDNLVPSDWRLWKGNNDRVWCESSKIPSNIMNPVKGECTHDYHVVAKEKALNVMAVFDESGNPVRCVKKLKL